MDELQNRMEIVYTVAELAFENRMEIAYTIYAPVFLEGVSTTEYYSEAYILVHGYTPSTTITDGEGFLFVDEPGFYGVSETISDGAGHLFVVDVPYLAGASETVSDGAGYLFVVDVPYLAGASETVSDGEGFQRTGTRFLVLAATETGGDGRFLASTPRPLSGVSDTYSDGEGSLYSQVFFQGSTITETDGDVILSFTVVSYRGYSALETVGEGFLFVEVFVAGSSSTDTVADAYLLIGIPMRGTSLTETASDASPFDPVYPRDIPGASLTIAEGDGFLFADLFLRGPSATKAEGRGRLSTDAYLRSMEEDTKTDGDGFLFSKVPLWGVSDTDASGEGRFIAPRPIPMGGVSRTSTDGDGRFYIIVSLVGASSTWTYGYGFLHTWVYLGPGPEEPIPPSITETTGFGRFLAPFPCPMDGGSLTVTDSEGRITEAKFFAGTSATESDGTGEVSILRALMGMSVTLTDGSASAPLVWVLMRGLSFTRTDGDADIDVDKPTGELVEAQYMVRRLPDTYNKEQESRITRLFRLVGQQVTELQRTLRTTERQRDIDQARGATLDAIGRNVSQGRGGLSDAAYRVLIKAKIARNISSGDVDAIKETLAAMLNIQTDDIRVRQMWLAMPPEPAAVEVHAPLHALDRFGLSPEQFATIVQSIVAAGVRASTWLGGTFELSEELEQDVERGLADDEMTFGGTLSGYYEIENIDWEDW